MENEQYEMKERLIEFLIFNDKKVKQSLYTPCRRLGEEEL
jgi:hypothetical protein